MRKFYKFFASLKIAILLIFGLMVLALLGTLIPQKAELVEYAVRYPESWNYLLALGLDNVYGSFLFAFLLVLLSVSTLVCILTRWKLTSKKLFYRISKVNPKEISALIYSKKISGVSEKTVRLFKQNRLCVDGSLLGLTITGRFSLLGGLLIHIGFLAILAGALIGSLYGVETVISGREGERVPIPSVEALRAAKKADLIAKKARGKQELFAHNHQLNSQLEAMSLEVSQLHSKYFEALSSPEFRVCFDKLWIDEHVSNDGKILGIKSWNSKIRFEDANSSSEPITLRVNHPFTYKGYSFYQANWSEQFAEVEVKFELREGQLGTWETFKTDETFPKYLKLKLNEPIKPPWSDFTFKMVGFYPDYRMIDGQAVSISNRLLNPAAWIIAYDQEENEIGRAVAFFPDRVFMVEHLTNLPFLITFASAQPTFESELQLSYDPGKPLVWLGSLLFSLGLLMCFYIPYKEEWFIRTPDNKYKIAVAANRPLDTMIDWLAQLENKVHTLETDKGQK